SGGLSLVTSSHLALQNRRRGRRRLWLLLLGTSLGTSLGTLLGATAHAQTCQTAADMDASVGTALETAAKRYFEMAERGDGAALKQNSIAAVASSFAGIEVAVKENKAALANAKAAIRPPFLLI